MKTKKTTTINKATFEYLYVKKLWEVACRIYEEMGRVWGACGTAPYAEKAKGFGDYIAEVTEQADLLYQGLGNVLPTPKNMYGNEIGAFDWDTTRDLARTFEAYANVHDGETSEEVINTWHEEMDRGLRKFLEHRMMDYLQCGLRLDSDWITQVKMEAVIEYFEVD